MKMGLLIYVICFDVKGLLYNLIIIIIIVYFCCGTVFTLKRFFLLILLLVQKKVNPWTGRSFSSRNGTPVELSKTAKNLCSAANNDLLLLGFCTFLCFHHDDLVSFSK